MICMGYQHCYQLTQKQCRFNSNDQFSILCFPKDSLECTPSKSIICLCHNVVHQIVSKRVSNLRFSIKKGQPNPQRTQKSDWFRGAFFLVLLGCAHFFFLPGKSTNAYHICISFNISCFIKSQYFFESSPSPFPFPQTLGTAVGRFRCCSAQFATWHWVLFTALGLKIWWRMPLQEAPRPCRRKRPFKSMRSWWRTCNPCPGNFFYWWWDWFLNIYIYKTWKSLVSDSFLMGSEVYPK